jgi:hypothetical protein
MQADTTLAMTLKSRQLWSRPHAVTLGAALVAAAIFLGVQGAQWLPLAEHKTQVVGTRADHPWGVLVPVAPEPAPSPARMPQATAPVGPVPLAHSSWAIIRGTFTDIAPDTWPVAPEPQLARRDMSPTIDVPLPPRRPSTNRAATARREAPAADPTPTSDNRGLFERLFNIQPGDRTALAYATPQDGAVSGALRGATQPMPMGYADGLTAVYDISAKAVILPNGETLEAHSGLGNLLDDPNRVHIKNRGPTPPTIYELSLREHLFHGVRALRLNPVNASDMYGRDGMLAHSYMLGPNGESNGCVSFKDYDRFLRAYLNGDVKRLIVVQRRA